MADRLGMPLSSYMRYETAARYKKPYLPLELAKRIAKILADYRIEVSEVLQLAGIGIDEVPAPTLSAAEEQLLELFRSMLPEQRTLLLQVAGQMVGGGGQAPVRVSGESDTAVLHDKPERFREAS